MEGVRYLSSLSRMSGGFSGESGRDLILMCYEDVRGEVVTFVSPNNLNRLFSEPVLRRITFGDLVVPVTQKINPPVVAR